MQEGLLFPDFKTLYKSTVTETSMVLSQKQTYRPIGQDRNTDMGTCNYNHLTFVKDAKDIYWRKDSLLNK